MPFGSSRRLQQPQEPYATGVQSPSGELQHCQLRALSLSELFADVGTRQLHV